MKITKQAQREARQLFRSCLVNGVVDEDKVRQCARLLGSMKPRGFMGILSRLHRLVKLELARRSVTVESTIEITGAQQSDLRRRLESQYGPGLKMGFHTNPDLIGGMRIQVGSDLYDGSVKTRLNKLEQSF